jgi:hypothetical protein
MTLPVRQIAASPEDDKPPRKLDEPLVLRPFMRFLRTDHQEIQCSVMRLEPWHDRRPPIFEGSGLVRLEGTKSIRFEMHGHPLDLGEALKAVRAHSEHPNDQATWMRLVFTDYQGTDWNAGWVSPTIGEVHGTAWQIFGECSSLTTDVLGAQNSSGVELAYSPAPEVPFSERMTTVTRLAEADIAWRAAGGRHRMSLLGCDIEIGSQAWAAGLWVVADSNPDLQHPYLENWLSEPLRALTGQLVYPRLVARKFSDGRAIIWVRRSPGLERSFGGCSRSTRDRSPAEFWRFYELYLTYVAGHRDATGSPSFEANLLTQLQDEVIQARRAGSPWVIALTVASAVEGALKLLPDFSKVQPEVSKEELTPVAALLPTFTDKRVRKYVERFVEYVPKPSAGGYLRRQQKAGVIDKGSVDAWQEVRHRVMHGNLFEPWSEENQDARLRLLIKLFYDITAHAIGYSKSSPPAGASGQAAE